MAVTLTKRDWSGEQVKVQNKSKKFFLQAGQDEMMGSAFFKFDFRASIYFEISTDKSLVGLTCIT